MPCKNCTKIKKSYVFLQPSFIPYNPIISSHFLDYDYCCCQQGLINKCEDCKKNKDITKECQNECLDESPNVCFFCNIL